MRTDLTDIVLVIDRSGSMGDCKVATEEAINSFIQQQRELPGEVRVSLIEFNGYVTTKYRRQPLSKIEPYVLRPAGGTALLDAIGLAIDNEGHDLSAMNEADRPGLVVVAVVTDGKENESRYFRSKEQIKQKIKTQSEVYSWQFTFLGAHPEAFDDAVSLGFNRDSVAYFDKSKSAYGSALSSNVGNMRCAVRTMSKVVNTYTKEELDAIK